MADMGDAATSTVQPIGRDFTEVGRQAPASPIDEVRRFMARWTCDRAFREELLVDPRAAVAARGLQADSEQLRIFWDDDFRAEWEQLPRTEALRRIGPLGLVWLEVQRREKEYRKSVRDESSPSAPRFAAWRRRQISRCELSFRTELADLIPHAPFAIELSKGCSVGCWFCGVSAPKLDGHFLRTEKNVEVFRQLMRVLAAVVGRTAGKWGILYWATDPFDHPEYERFCSDFESTFGQMPITTTAQGWKDLPRLRRLIRDTAASGNSRVRLSILNLKMLDVYLSELNAEELAAVSFVPINKDSVYQPAHAGRARTKRPKAWGNPLAVNATDASISCVTGFHFNLVDRRIRLISPCAASDEWPDGSFIYDERQFADADDLESVIRAMIDRHMPIGVPTDRTLRFNSDLAYDRLPNGFRLSSEMNCREFQGDTPLGEVGDLIATGGLAMPQFMSAMEQRFGTPASTMVAVIDQLFASGLLEGEPK